MTTMTQVQALTHLQMVYDAVDGKMSTNTMAALDMAAAALQNQPKNGMWLNYTYLKDHYKCSLCRHLTDKNNAVLCLLRCQNGEIRNLKGRTNNGRYL